MRILMTGVGTLAIAAVFGWLAPPLPAAPEGGADIDTRTVEYKEGETVLEGYLAVPAGEAGKRPGVIVVHEWMGLNDYARMRAELLARMGYVALAADVYGKGIRAKTPEEAAALAGRYKGDRPLLRKRVLAALDCLKGQPGVDPDLIAAIGYCFGGTAVLELARSGASVKGVVSFHGGLSTSLPAGPDAIRAKVLVLHGADDPYVPAKEVAGFEEEMRKARADWRLVAYEGTVHSFTNPAAGSDPASGARYNADADKRSWEEMRGFLAERFGR